MHTLTSFYVSATDGVGTFDEYNLSSLSLFSGAADVSSKAERMPQTFNEENRHAVARICCRLTSYTRKVHLFKRFCAVQNSLRGLIKTECTDASWVDRMKYVRNYFSSLNSL